MDVTMKDIANKLGISINTVWKAINNKPNISTQTKKLVLKNVRESNYIPNTIARSLVTKKTNTVGVLIYDIMDSFYAEVLNGIENIAAKNKYNILLCNSKNDSDQENKSIRMLFEKRIDGLLLCPTQKDDRYIKILKGSKVPFVFLNRRSDLLKCNYVINDYSYGSYIAIDYMIKKGYKKIYFFSSHPQTSSTMEKIEGCKKAFSKNKIPLKNLKIINCDREINSYYNTTIKKINYKGEKIGIHVWDDQMAVGVCKAIIDKGLKIPDDIGIIGYDDTVTSQHLLIPLTTVRNPAYEIGIKAMKTLIDRIKSKDLLKVEEIILEPKLIIRNTA